MNILRHDVGQGQWRETLERRGEFVDRPPSPSINDLPFDPIGHTWNESCGVDDEILLRLANPAAMPIERMLPPPHHRPKLELAEPHLLQQLSSKSDFDGLAALDAAARRDPERLRTFRRLEPKKQKLAGRSQKQRTDGLPVNDHPFEFSVKRRQDQTRCRFRIASELRSCRRSPKGQDSG